MSNNLKALTNVIFRKQFERCEYNSQLKPYFIRFIGIDNENDFNNVISTLEDKINQHKDICIVFDNEIQLSGEMELIQYIYNELNNMNIMDMQNQDIVLFDDFETNFTFLRALDYVIPLAIRNENFFNDSVRNNFITKLIVWAYTHIKNVNVKDNIPPKCFYYGKITKHEVYFLMLLHKMKFDVIYINPLREEFFEDIDKDNLSEIKQSLAICPIDSFYERAKLGTVIEQIETITKQLERDIETQLFSGTGMYKPWQFRGGYSKGILLNTILEDVYMYWREPAKLREGFKVVDKTVNVPCFFKKVDGQYLDMNEYQRLVKHCVSSSENTLFFNHGNITGLNSLSDDMYQLMFCQLSDGTFDIEEVKKLNIYKLSKYSNEVQNLILNKFNEMIKLKDVFVKPLDKENTLKLFVLVLSLNEDIVRLIDNFDFTSYIPKIVIYLNNEDKISDLMVMLLGYLHLIGIDIVIFNPSGLFNIHNILKEDVINTVRLEKMNYTSTYSYISNIKQGLLSKIFGK